MFLELSGVRALDLEHFWENYCKQKWQRPTEAVVIEVRGKIAMRNLNISVWE